MLITCFSFFLSKYNAVPGCLLFLFGLESRSSSIRTSPHVILTKNDAQIKASCFINCVQCPNQTIMFHQLCKLIPLKTVENRLLIYLPNEAYFFIFQCIYSAFKECQSVFKKLKSLFHHVPSTTNVCNLTPHPKTTIEYVKSTPDRPNSGQDPLSTATDTRGISTSKGTKDTKHN